MSIIINSDNTPKIFCWNKNKKKIYDAQIWRSFNSVKSEQLSQCYLVLYWRDIISCLYILPVHFTMVPNKKKRFLVWQQYEQCQRFLACNYSDSVTDTDSAGFPLYDATTPEQPSIWAHCRDSQKEVSFRLFLILFKLFEFRPIFLTVQGKPNIHF